MTDDVKNQAQSADLGNEVTATASIDAAVKAADEGAAATTDAPAKELSLREMELMTPDELEKLLATDTGTTAAASTGEQTADGADTVAGAADGAASDTGADTVAAGTKADGIMIPKARLDDEIEKRRKAEEELAFFKGKTEGMREAGAKPGDAAPDPRQAIQEFDNALVKLDNKYKEERDKIADQFEAGKLTEKQKLHAYDRLVEQRNGIEEKILAGRDRLVEQMNTPSPEQLVSNPELQEATQKLYKDEPWILNLPPAAVKRLKDITERTFAEEGAPLKQTVEDVWKLRAGMAAIGKELGMDVKYATKPGTAPANAQNQGGAKTGGKNPLPTPDQVAAKLNLASKVPPAPGAAGTTAAAVTSDLQQIEDNVKDKSEWEMGMNHSKEFFQKALGV